MVKFWLEIGLNTYTNVIGQEAMAFWGNARETGALSQSGIGSNAPAVGGLQLPARELRRGGVGVQIDNLPEDLQRFVPLTGDQ